MGTRVERHSEKIVSYIMVGEKEIHFKLQRCSPALNGIKIMKNYTFRVLNNCSQNEEYLLRLDASYGNGFIELMTG